MTRKLAFLTTLLLATALQAAPPHFAPMTDLTASTGGLCIQLGPTDGALTTHLATHGKMLIHALPLDEPTVKIIRADIQAAKIGEKAAAEALALNPLPYATNLANVVVAENLPVLLDKGLTLAEVYRVLAPKGTAYVGAPAGLDAKSLEAKVKAAGISDYQIITTNGVWVRFTKPRPAGMDEWTHHNHGPDGNPVSRDTELDVPETLRWVTGIPMGYGMFAIRSASARNVYFFDNRSRSIGLDNTSFEIEVRDAWNGAHLWTKCVPAGLNMPQRPAVVDGRIFVESGTNIVALDLKDGSLLQTYAESAMPYDYIVSDGVLICRNAKGTTQLGPPPSAKDPKPIKPAEPVPAYDDSVRGIDVATGKLLWSLASSDMPDIMRAYHARRPGNFTPGWRLQVLIAGNGKVYFADAKKTETKSVDKKGKETITVTYKPRLVGLDIKTGQEAWVCEDEKIGKTPHPTFFADGNLYLTNESGYAAASTTDGRVWSLTVKQWNRDKTKLEDRFAAFAGNPNAYLETNGLVWIRDSAGLVIGQNEPWAGTHEKPVKGWVGLNPKTGTIEKRIEYPTTQGWSGRCYPDVATPKYILSENTEIVNLKSGDFLNLKGARGQCGSGFIVANGLFYTPPIQCIYCYPMIRGAAAYESLVKSPEIPLDKRLEKGPAWMDQQRPIANVTHDWPMYRHDAERSNATPAKVDPATLGLKWDVSLGTGRITGPIVAGGKVIAAAMHEHRVVAIDVATGKLAWSFEAGGRIDTPPSALGDRVFFGAHDGSVYAIRLADGALIWRYAVAPSQRRIVAFEQVESPWPVMGSVLIHNGTLYALAGWLTRMDGGMHLVALDPATGSLKWQQTLKGVYGEKARTLPVHWYKHENHMTNNVLVAQGEQLRLYDQHGLWEFSTRDGTQIDPPTKDAIGAGISGWRWAGWDRVTIQYILRGQEPYFKFAIGMDPRPYDSPSVAPKFPDATTMPARLVGIGGFTNPKTPGSNLWVFPAKQGFGVNIKRQDRAAVCELCPASFDKPDVTMAQLPWPPIKTTTDIKACIIAGNVAFYAGGKTFGIQHEESELRAVALVDGKESGPWPFKGGVCFDGMAAGASSIFVSTQDGRVLCFGAR